MSKLLSDKENYSSYINQLILSCNFDISLRTLYNKATDMTMRCGVTYTLDLCLHIPKYPTNPFYDELCMLDFSLMMKG